MKEVDAVGLKDISEHLHVTVRRSHMFHLGFFFAEIRICYDEYLDVKKNFASHFADTLEGFRCIVP